MFILNLDELFQVFKYWPVGRITNDELVMRTNLISLKRQFAWIDNSLRRLDINTSRQISILTLAKSC